MGGRESHHIPRRGVVNELSAQTEGEFQMPRRPHSELPNPGKLAGCAGRHVAVELQARALVSNRGDGRVTGWAPEGGQRGAGSVVSECRVKAWEDVGETVPLPDDDVPISGTRAQGRRGGPSLVPRAGWLHQRCWFRLGESLVVLRRRGDPSDGVPEFGDRRQGRLVKLAFE